MKNKILMALTIMVLVSVGIAQAVPPAERETIFDVAISINEDSGEFSILIAALQAANPVVIETLDGNGQYTVFAPKDEAFVNLLGKLGLTAEELLAEEELVTQVLLYHVAHGRIYAEDVIEKERIRTLQRGFLYVDGTELTDNNGRTSNIILVDVEADNGVIHVIDTLVLP